ncbi:DUF4254 domain-containing protein [Mariniblastus sp.]|nr:DUF4254 domain-containing protein [Mariniblastus sp.]
MSLPINLDEVLQLHASTVTRWHDEDIDNPYAGLQGTICTQHSFNFQLWHEEDIARSPDVSDAEIARVKRSIDRFNQQRNDWIEKVDDAIMELVASKGTPAAEDAPLNTETPGSTIDRLSIMSLRIFHLQEQLDRDDVAQDHFDSVNHKLAVCKLQQSDLKQSLEELLSDIFSGKKRHRTYRQFKMYNDPALNPYLYDGKRASNAIANPS